MNKILAFLVRGSALYAGGPVDIYPSSICL
jgi:hypothetical protein